MARAQVIRWLMFEQRYVQTSISRLRYWMLTGKLDQFARDVATAQAVGNRALDVLDGELGKRPFIAGTHIQSRTYPFLRTATSPPMPSSIFLQDRI
jgi:glutathione S-transferase